MPNRDTIVIGASAGGIEALSQLVRRLPADLPSAIFIVVHIAAYYRSYLPNILNRAKTLLAAHAEDREPIQPGRIYIGQPNRHMLIENEHVCLVYGPTPRILTMHYFP